MIGQVLLPSCNWFLPSVASCSNDGTLAYGTRNGIVLIRSIVYEDGVGPVIDFNQIPNAHKDKVTAMMFCNREISAAGLPSKILASASEDGMLKIWDCTTLQLAFKLLEHRDKVTCLDWSHKGNLLLVSGDDRGKIVVWDVLGNAARTINVLNGSRLAPYSVACSPWDQDLVAVGCKDGLVCIVNIQGSGQIVTKLRGHDKSAVSLSWCPSEEGTDDGHLLASGGLDQKIYIWQTKLNRCVKTLSMPVKQLSKGFRARSDNSKGNIVSWLPVVWLKPKLLLSASLSSEVLAWNPMEDKPTPKLVHGEHMRGLACITALPCSIHDTNWRSPEKPYVVWSLAQDRQIVRADISPHGTSEHKITKAVHEKCAAAEEVECELEDGACDKDGSTTEGEENTVKDTGKKKVALNVKTTALPTIGGYVYFMSPCPFVPGRVAIGVGDDTIRVWNMCDTTAINVTTVWQRIKGKVMALAWHPENEGLLGFGTGDGRVGVYNVSNLNKEPIVFKQYHRSTVYRVAWGPPAYKKGEEAPPSNKQFCLYASDETISVYYDIKNLDKGPVLLKPIIKDTNPKLNIDTKHKEIAWKSDFSMLAIGLEDGCIQLLSAPHLQIVHTLMAHKKCIYFLLWHPLSTATDTDLEPPHKHWLASSAVDQTICVFNVAPLLPNEAGEWKNVPLPIEPFSELRHGGKVVGMCWNPHISGQIATSSYDKSVKVWDVVKQELLSCYQGHTGCVLSCCWSFLDPDLMLSGSSDFSVHCWKISQAPPPLPADDRRALKAAEESQKTAASPDKAITIREVGPKVVRASVAPSSKDTKKKFQKLTKSQLFPVSSAASYNKEMALICCEQILRSQGVLPQAVPPQAVPPQADPPQAVPQADTNGVDPQATQTEDHKRELAKCEAVKAAPNIGYFTSQDNFLAMLDADSRGHKLNGNYKGCQSLDLWRGNLTESLKSAAQSNTLNEALVSLAPTVSHKMWQEMCAAYAEQLIKEEDFIKATSYLIACHKVLDAVNLLRSQKLFREALVLSRCRLGSDDPVTKEVMLQWAHSSANLGNYELAAQCYISCGDYDNAASVLNKRQDTRMWKLGALLAKQTGNTSLQTSLASEFLYSSLVNEKWDEASDIIEQNLDLKPLEVLIPVHRLLCQLSKEEAPSSEQLATLWRGEDTDSPESLLAAISDICKSRENLHHKLLPLMPARSHTPESRKEWLVQISRHLLLAISAREAGDDNWERPIVDAMNISYRRGLTCVTERPLHYLVWWLRAPVPLDKLGYSEMVYICVVMLERLDWGVPEAGAVLLRFKPYLFDTESAAFSRLGVLIRSKEKQVAAATANKLDVTQSQQELASLKKEVEQLEKERVSFPNALIMFCKLQTVVDKMKQKNVLSDEEFEMWANDLEDYRNKLEK